MAAPKVSPGPWDPYLQNQRGGEYTFNGITGYSAGGVPIDARTAYDNCANDYRPAPHIAMPVFTGGARKKGKRSGQRSQRRTQRGGGCGCMGSIAPMRGGGSGNGGFALGVGSNALGKTFDSYNVGACPPPQVGGAAGDPVYSYPAGYSYGAKSFVEAGNGTAHYIDPIGYGSVMTGGKRSGHKKSRKSRKSRKASKKSRKSCKGRKH